MYNQSLNQLRHVLLCLMNDPGANTAMSFFFFTILRHSGANIERVDT